jgi:hypothetical protein
VLFHTPPTNNNVFEGFFIAKLNVTFVTLTNGAIRLTSNREGSVFKWFFKNIIPKQDYPKDYFLLLEM